MRRPLVRAAAFVLALIVATLYVELRTTRHAPSAYVRRVLALVRDDGSALVRELEAYLAYVVEEGDADGQPF